MGVISIKKICIAVKNPHNAVQVLIASIWGWSIKMKYRILKPSNVFIGKRFRRGKSTD